MWMKKKNLFKFNRDIYYNTINVKKLLMHLDNNQNNIILMIIIIITNNN